MKNFFVFILILVAGIDCFSQTPPPVKKEQRRRLHKQLISNTILGNLYRPLSDSTESNWEDAFYAIELIGYQSPLVNRKINEAFESLPQRSVGFQRSLLELAYANYKTSFKKQTLEVFSATPDSKIFSMCAVYLSPLLHGNDSVQFKKEVAKRLAKYPHDPILQRLALHLESNGKKTIKKIGGLLDKNYLKGNVLLISFQRKNRDFPGLAIVRDTAGNFVSKSGRLFSVPQLARSMSGLPGFLTNGNTPQGIFRMDGIDTSKSLFIGPTPNLQLTMPFELGAAHYFRDEMLADSAWSTERYSQLLPPGLAGEQELYESYFAGMAGRTEIIAHGTTVDPRYFISKPFYPLTPTQGCLTSKEMWNEKTGNLIESDQQQLTEAVITAGGAHGYAIVIDLDDQHIPVSPEEIKSLLETANAR